LHGKAKIEAPISRCLSVEPIALVVVKPRRRIMVHRNRRIIHDPPSGPLNRQAGNHVVMRLRASATQSFVEPDREDCHHPERKVRPLKKINIPGLSCTNVMIADGAAEPQKAANQSAVSVIDAIGLMHPVPPPNRPHCPVACEMSFYANRPVRPGRRVVIRNGDNVPVAAGKAGIQRMNLPCVANTHNLKREFVRHFVNRC
jgi:hypothetical protein